MNENTMNEQPKFKYPIGTKLVGNRRVVGHRLGDDGNWEYVIRYGYSKRDREATLLASFVDNFLDEDVDDETEEPKYQKGDRLFVRDDHGKLVMRYEIVGDPFLRGGWWMYPVQQGFDAAEWVLDPYILPPKPAEVVANLTSEEKDRIVTGFLGCFAHGGSVIHRTANRKLLDPPEWQSLDPIRKVYGDDFEGLRGQFEGLRGQS